MIEPVKALGRSTETASPLAGPVVLSVSLQAITLSYVFLTAIIGSLVLRFIRGGFDRESK